MFLGLCRHQHDVYILQLLGFGYRRQKHLLSTAVYSHRTSLGFSLHGTTAQFTSGAYHNILLCFCF
jgi:hypothetical protein